MCHCMVVTQNQEVKFHTLQFSWNWTLLVQPTWMCVCVCVWDVTTFPPFSTLTSISCWWESRNRENPEGNEACSAAALNTVSSIPSLICELNSEGTPAGVRKHVVVSTCSSCDGRWEEPAALRMQTAAWVEQQHLTENTVLEQQRGGPSWSNHSQSLLSWSASDLRFILVVSENREVDVWHFLVCMRVCVCVSSLVSYICV